MRIVPAPLALSLIANLALGWLVFAPAAPAPSSPAPSVPATAAPTLTPSVAARATENPAALRDRLRALGFSPSAVQAALRAHLEAPHLARLRGLRSSTPPLPWWHGITGARFTPEQERELRALRRTEREALTRLFGPAGTVVAAETESYLFLPPDKAARLAALERDYRELRDQLAESGPTDPAAVDERKRLLRADRERDLAALLDPDERTALELRQSPTARQLAQRFTYFEGSAADYRALYDLQQSFHEKFPPTAGGALVFYGDGAHSVAEKQLALDQQTALGPDRFAAWQLTQRAYYRALVDVQRRFEIAPTAATAMIDLPPATATAANLIFDDRSLTPAQRTTALKALATETRAQVQATLGSHAAEAYLAASGSQWLVHLERGSSVTFGPTGIETVRSGSPTPPPTR